MRHPAGHLAPGRLFVGFQQIGEIVKHDHIAQSLALEVQS